MPTVTIPKKLSKNDDLIVVPRKEYEALIRAKNGAGNRRTDSAVVVRRTMKVPKKYEGFYNKVDKDITEILRDVRAGKVSGSFTTTDELFTFLDRPR